METRSRLPKRAPRALQQQQQYKDGTASIQRTFEDYGGKCKFRDGDRIVLAGPFSLQSHHKYFFVGRKMRTAYELVVDYVNRNRCGIALNGRRYPVELRTYDDESDIVTTTQIARRFLTNDDVHVVLAGLASDVTKPLADEVYDSGNSILIAGGSAVSSIFAGRDTLFTTLPPSDGYLRSAMEALRNAGATSIAAFWDNHPFTRAACGAAESFAAKYGMQLTSMQQVVVQPNNMTQVFQPLAAQLCEEKPDVVFSCTYHCEAWMKAMRKQNWSPKAQVFTICVGSSTFAQQVGPDAEYIFGVTPWQPNLPLRDGLTGWTSHEFAQLLQNELNDVDVAYQAAAAAGAISTVLQAIEGANTTEPKQLARYMAETSFATMYEQVTFDGNGQTKAPMLLVQTDDNLNAQTVFPRDQTGRPQQPPIIYPMPSWGHRDCVRLAPCGKSTAGNIHNDTCSPEGHCICGEPEYFVSWGGAGANARCVPREKLEFIKPALISCGYFFVALVLAIACFACAYVHVYRNNALIVASQPLFLYLIIAGSVISVLSIIPMGAETGHRAESDDITRVDAACMAVPWLWGLGFSITFSALLAKIWRVKRLYHSGIHVTRRQVGYHDVLPIFVVMVVIESGILLAFQLVSPHRWKREVTINFVGGYPLSSVGHCYSDLGWLFYLALVIVNILSMCYALILCFETRHIPSQFAEGGYIFLSIMFMFQILVLGIPVLALVQDDMDTFYFVRATAVFLQSITVLVIIFLPKMVRIYKGEDTVASIRDSLRVSVQSSRTLRVPRGQSFERRGRELRRPPVRSTNSGSRSPDISADFFDMLPPQEEEEEQIDFNDVTSTETPRARNGAPCSRTLDDSTTTHREQEQDVAVVDKDACAASASPQTSRVRSSNSSVAEQGTPADISMTS